MKKIRILSGLLVVILVMVMMTNSVFAVSDEKEVLSDVPYDYGVLKNSDDWNSMSIIERKKVFTIDKVVSKNMTTEALLESIFNNPYIWDIFAYNTIEDGINAKEFRFQFNELFGRNDLSSILQNKIKDIMTKYNYTSIMDLHNKINYANEQELLDIDKVLLCYTFLEYMEQQNIEIVQNSRETGGIVQTISGLQVLCSYDCTWSDHGIFSETLAIRAEEEYLTEYPNAVKLAERNPAYNCHSYAWHLASTGNKVWIPSSQAGPYLDDLLCFRVSSAGVDRKVVYFSDNNTVMAHSGIVDDVLNNVVYVVSKWGTAPLYRHPVNESPYTEDASAIFYYNYGNQS